MRHEIHIGRNSLSTDLGVEEGGEGLGPSPHDLYDAALGACKALTVLWYAKHKGIPVQGIEVSVERDASQERDRKSTRLNSSHLVISYAVFCLKKKKCRDCKRKPC